jgi:hypothetical protein
MRHLRYELVVVQMNVVAQSRSAFSGERENSEDPVRVYSSWTSWENSQGVSDLSGKQRSVGRDLRQAE